MVKGHVRTNQAIKLICFGAIDVTKAYNFIWSGDSDVTKPGLAQHRVPDGERLPTASTCANLLKLPDYNTKEAPWRAAGGG